MSAAAERIGLGRLVLVVGPSGAGKDTLIAGARAACASDHFIVFPRGVITRPSTATEDHDTMSVEAFRQAAALGRFALWWEAHGLFYGIPTSIDDDIRARRTIVCNVSRTITAAPAPSPNSTAVARSFQSTIVESASVPTTSTRLQSPARMDESATLTA